MHLQSLLAVPKRSDHKCDAPEIQPTTSPDSLNKCLNLMTFCLCVGLSQCQTGLFAYRAGSEIRSEVVGSFRVDSDRRSDT